MAMNRSSNRYFVRTEAGDELFYPWPVVFGLLGVGEAYRLPSEAVHDALAKFINRFGVLWTGAFVVGVLFGKLTPR